MRYSNNIAFHDYFLSLNDYIWNINYPSKWKSILFKLFNNYKKNFFQYNKTKFLKYQIQNRFYPYLSISMEIAVMEIKHLILRIKDYYQNVKEDTYPKDFE